MIIQNYGKANISLSSVKKLADAFNIKAKDLLNFE